ncbi:TetR/AcrR family transcriptional regulator [Stackebrandtia soli]|uniref:TetR/AcrR family transcriptional regulator n=1 Tax=Stackebrandtia soli TaxID=1892856 RepID=UPI0039E8AC31
MSDDRREHILRVATTIATEEGMAALSVRTVATRAGMGASTLRHYFPSQRDLYDAVAARLFHAQLSDLRIADASIPATDRLVECLGQFLPQDDTRTKELEGWLTLHASAVGAGPGEQGSRLLATLARQGRDRVESWLAILDEQGMLRQTAPRHHTATLLALLDGLCLSLLTPQSTVTAEAAHEILRTVVVQVIVAPATKESTVALLSTQGGPRDPPTCRGPLLRPGPTGRRTTGEVAAGGLADQAPRWVVRS